MNCSRSARSVGVLLVLAFAASALAHDESQSKPHTHDSTTHSHVGLPEKSAQPQLGTALILPRIDGPKPWSARPPLTDPQRFSIAIVTDRTGGHRPGIWMKAVERINWLRPDFVVSVGDLIEGYTDDDDEIEEQWSEFLGFIDQLQMKFFFVAGNHDVTNPKLHRVWREKFGREWYSFDYKGVHFVCLSSEDPSAQIGEEQLTWLAGDLDQHANARWTLVFLHKPLWTSAEQDIAAGNEDRSNWKRVEKLLADRPHTVFAGHVHHYVQYQRNGQQYYSLATTGGGSQLRGLQYGEFDHITWLTMEHDGPHVANLLLDGIQPANIVTEESITSFRRFLTGIRIEVEPILISGDTLRKGEIRITLHNDYHTAITADATIDGLPLVGLQMKPGAIHLEAQAGKSVQKVVSFAMAEPLDIRRFRLTTLTANVTSEDKVPVKAEVSMPVVIDREYKLVQRDVTIDGRLDEWQDNIWWPNDDAPVLDGAIENWNGPADSSVTLTASYANDQIVLAATIQDENVMPGDRLTLAIDPRPLLSRLTNRGLGQQTLVVSVEPPASQEPGPCSIKPLAPFKAEGLAAFGKRTPTGYQLEFSMPIDNFTKAQGANWSDVQMGARLTDVDSPEEKPVDILWRATKSRLENRGYAHLIRK